MSYPYSYKNSQPAFQPNRGYPANNGYNTPPTHNYGYQQPQHQPQQPLHYSGGGYNQPPAPVQNRSPVEAFRGYYADRLRELTLNSRPLIQDLSIMAMQQRDNGNWDNMAGVVEEIEIAVYRVRLTSDSDSQSWLQTSTMGTLWWVWRLPVWADSCKAVPVAICIPCLPQW